MEFLYNFDIYNVACFIQEHNFVLHIAPLHKYLLHTAAIKSDGQRCSLIMRGNHSERIILFTSVKNVKLLLIVKKNIYTRKYI